MVTREELMMALWSTDEYVSDGTLTTVICRLRGKLKAACGKDLVGTKKGTGVFPPGWPAMMLLRYARARWRSALPCLLLLLLSDLYLALAIPDDALSYLLYLDALFLVPALLWTGIDCASFIRSEEEKERLLGQDILLCHNLPAFQGQEIAEHDVRLLEAQLRTRF